MHFWSTNEQYVFEERLALLGVVGRRATRREEEVALRDVERFRAERTDKPVSKKKFAAVNQQPTNEQNENDQTRAIPI